MFEQPEVTEQQVREAAHKAEVIQSLVNHEGWKLLTDLIDKVIAKEVEGLAGQDLDPKYYKKIGFLQSIVYFQALPNIIKDKKIREYLLMQGRLIGFRWAQKSPKHFFEAGKTAQKFIAEQNQKSKDASLQLKEKRKFLEEQKTV